jgi:hypothetical protein
LKGSEFLQKPAKLSSKPGIEMRFVGSEGNGSHGRVSDGTEFTTLKDRKKEIGPGLLLKMCRDLGIDRKDL